MPKKINGAGQMQEYIPAGNGKASGEYGTSSGENKHFQKFGKDDGEKQIESVSSQPKLKYNGKGKEKLTDSLSNKLKGANGRITPNGKILLENLKNADDEYSGLIGDFIEQRTDIDLKIGKNLKTEYVETTYQNYYTGNRWSTYEVKIGSSMFGNKNDYAEGAYFFHEYGHAIDNSYIDDTGHRNKFSYAYKSDKYGKTLNEMIQEEISNNIDYDKLSKEYKTFCESFKGSAEWKEINDEKTKIEKELSIEDQRIHDSPKYRELKQEEEELSKIFSESNKKWSETFNRKDYDAMQLARQNVLDKMAEKREFFNSQLSEEYQQKNKRRGELLDKEYKMEIQANNNAKIAYGDLSDMIQGTLGDDKKLCMGHNEGYFNSEKSNRGEEAFAEIMSANATNPESLKQMKKYIPKSLEIFDEIIGKIKGV